MLFNMNWKVWVCISGKLMWTILHLILEGFDKPCAQPMAPNVLVRWDKLAACLLWRCALWISHDCRDAHWCIYSSRCFIPLFFSRTARCIRLCSANEELPSNFSPLSKHGGSKIVYMSECFKNRNISPDWELRYVNKYWLLLFPSKVLEIAVLQS